MNRLEFIDYKHAVIGALYADDYLDDDNVHVYMYIVHDGNTLDDLVYYFTGYHTASFYMVNR